MKNLIFKVTPENTALNEISLLVARVFFGFSMAFAHGLGKVPPPEMLVSGLGSMGFPAPIFFAWAAALSEFLGGILVGIGLLTRPAAIFLSITMAVAAFVAHGADGFDKKEMSLLYLVVYLIFALRGAGKWSVDGFIKK